MCSSDLTRTEPRHLNNQESLTQATGRCAVEDVFFCDIRDDVWEVPHDIIERLKFGNLHRSPGICRYFEEGLLNIGGVVVVGPIKCESACDGVESMDKAEVWLRPPLHEFITLLLDKNKLLYHVRLALGTHSFRLCSSTDPVVHASNRVCKTMLTFTSQVKAQ